MNPSHVYYLEGLEGPNLRLGADVRRKAGFDPALVVDVGVPAGSDAVHFAGNFRLRVGGTWTTFPPQRVEAWVLISGPRTPTEVEFTPVFESLSATARTLYKLYFQLRPAEIFELSVPTLTYRGGQLEFPMFVLSTGERTQPVGIAVATSEV